MFIKTEKNKEEERGLAARPLPLTHSEIQYGGTTGHVTCPLLLLRVNQ